MSIQSPIYECNSRIFNTLLNNYAALFVVTSTIALIVQYLLLLFATRKYAKDIKALQNGKDKQQEKYDKDQVYSYCVIVCVNIQRAVETNTSTQCNNSSIPHTIRCAKCCKSNSNCYSRVRMC
jgi:hypothetical protein